MGGEARIHLTLEAILAQYAPADAEELALPHEMTVAELIRYLGIPEHLVMFAMVNGHMSTLDTRVRDRASVALCPYICGG